MKYKTSTHKSIINMKYLCTIFALIITLSNITAQETLDIDLEQNKEIEALNKKIAELEKIIQSIENPTADLEKEKRQNRRKFADLEQAITQLQNQVKELHSSQKLNRQGTTNNSYSGPGPATNHWDGNCAAICDGHDEYWLETDGDPNNGAEDGPYQPWHYDADNNPVICDCGSRVTFIPYDDPPVPLRPIRPKYPEIAQEAGIEGTVVVQVFVDKTGRVTDTVILKGIPNTGLDESAIKAIRAVRFRPAKAGGATIGVWISIPVNFRLKS